MERALGVPAMHGRYHVSAGAAAGKRVGRSSRCHAYAYTREQVGGPFEPVPRLPSARGGHLGPSVPAVDDEQGGVPGRDSDDRRQVTSRVGREPH